MLKRLTQWLKGEASTAETVAADDLIAAEGDEAYVVARERARAARGTDTAAFKYWSAVAVLIADRSGRDIGVKAVDRYARKQ